jgi:type II secretory pathway component GspD/PulD (secretin)
VGVNPFRCIASGIFATILLIAIAHAAEPATGVSSAPSGPATYPKIINPTGATLPADRIFYSKPPPVMVTLDYKDAAIESVLEDLSGKTGYIFVELGPVEDRITLRSAKPVSSYEMLPLLDAALEADGYGVLPLGRILNVDSRTNLMFTYPGGPVRYSTDPDMIADTDNEIAHQIIPVKNLPADQLLKELRSSLPDIKFDAPDYTTQASGNLIIATDTFHNMRRVVQAVLKLDKPPTTGPTTTPATMPHAAESRSRGGQ